MTSSSLLQRFRALSPGRLLDGFRRSLTGDRVERPEVPRWLTVQAGPLAGIRLLIAPAAIDIYDEMAAGTYDSELVEALSRAPGIEGGVCWDVGAHMGYHSLLMARLVGPGGRVHAFEPNPVHRARLQLHLEANPELGARVELHEFALGGRNGAVEPLTGTPFEARENPRKHTADELLAAGYPFPVVVKLDVDGAEADILSGASSLLCEPRCLWLIEARHILLMLELARRFFEDDAEISVLEDHHATASRCFVQARPRA